MEAAVVDPGSKLLKAGPAIPDQAPSMVFCFNCFSFFLFFLFYLPGFVFHRCEQLNANSAFQLSTIIEKCLN